MNKKNKPEAYTSNILDELLSVETPELTQRVRNRMLLAAKIADGIKKMGWNKTKLAQMLNKQPSEITKYLSGTHNFTSDTLSDIQYVLGIKLLSIDELPKKETVVVYHAIVSGSELTHIDAAYPIEGSLLSETEVLAPRHVYNYSYN